MTPTITVFANSPDRGRGLARDMPVRWALEEAGRAYEVRAVSFAEMKGAAHKARQPFGQIPAYEEEGLTLFESGAIVLHIAGHCPALLPAEEAARARAMAWMFAALNTVEPPVFDYSLAGVLEKEKPWHDERRALLEARIHDRLGDLSRHLGEADWLEGAFSAGDLMMISVLRRLNGTGLLEAWPAIAAYVARGESRPAFIRAFDAQRALFTQSQAQQAQPLKESDTA